MQRSPRASFSPMMMSYPETSWTQGSFTQPSSRKRAEHQTSYLHSNCSLGVACESPSCCYLLFEGGFKTVCVLSSLTCARVNTAWHSKGRVLDIFIPYKLLANIQSLRWIGLHLSLAQYRKGVVDESLSSLGLLIYNFPLENEETILAYMPRIFKVDQNLNAC